MEEKGKVGRESEKRKAGVEMRRREEGGGRGDNQDWPQGGGECQIGESQNGQRKKVKKKS
jgi:hypothetical protein